MGRDGGGEPKDHSRAIGAVRETVESRRTI